MKSSIVKRTIIFAIFMFTITAITLLLIYKPYSGTVSAPAAPVTDEEAAAAQAVGEERITDAVAETTADIATETTADDKSPDTSEVRQINIYMPFDGDDSYRSIDAYAKKHWSFAYNLNVYTGQMVYSYSEVMSMINNSLRSGDGAVDIYRLPARYAPYYIKGEYSGYACTYKELGIDVDTALKNAGIPEYIIEAGRNPDGELIALPYLAETSVFLYNRSVARDVWGTDDPDIVADIIGGGTQKWDKFIEAAKTLKKHGYYIVPGFTDLSYMVDESPSFAGQDPNQGYGIDPVWEEYMDVSKQLFDSGCINDTRSWSSQWFDDLNGKGNKVFGIVTCANFIEYIINETAGDWAICMSPFTTRMDVSTGIMVNKNSPNKDLLGPLVEWMTLDCSKEGLQYGLASGTLFNDKKMSVVSGTVLKNADNSRDVLGGQSISSVILDTMMQPMGEHYGDSMCFDAIEAYLKGEKDKEAAISEFKSTLRKSGIMSEPYTEPASSASGPAKGEVIVWKDKNFESAVREVLFKPYSDIYTSDASRVTRLYLGEKVTNLEDLVHFKNLASLYLESNKINDISFLKDFTKLKELYIADNNISDISVLSGLTELEELYMSKNKISDISVLSGLAELEKLNMSKNEIGDISSLSRLTSLEYVDLSENNISDISALKKLSRLNELNLDYNDIKDISSLQNLKNLETLLLSGNKISDISSLKGLGNLKMLHLSGNSIADRSPADHVGAVSW